MNKLRPQL